jgi:hypothetical protein
MGFRCCPCNPAETPWILSSSTACGQTGLSRSPKLYWSDTGLLCWLMPNGANLPAEALNNRA